MRRRMAGRLGPGGGPGSGGVSALFSPEAEVLEEGEGELAQEHVVVQAAPAPTLEVVQPQLFLELLMQLLAYPARLDRDRQGLECRGGGKVGQVVLALAGRAMLPDEPVGSCAPNPRRAGAARVRRQDRRPRAPGPRRTRPGAAPWTRSATRWNGTLPAAPRATWRPPHSRPRAPGAGADGRSLSARERRASRRPGRPSGSAGSRPRRRGVVQPARRGTRPPCRTRHPPGRTRSGRPRPTHDRSRPARSPTSAGTRPSQARPRPHAGWHRRSNPPAGTGAGRRRPAPRRGPR